MKEGDNVLRIFEETKEAVKKHDVVKLKELSNQTIHAASVEQDADNIAVAVIIYSLGKIIEREDYRKYPGWNEFYKTIILLINNSIISLKKKDEKRFKEGLKLVRQAINKLSGKLKIFIKDVFRSATINKASRIYEHGISMEKTASLLGISMFELAEYAGKTGIPDVAESKTLNVKSRIKIAMEMFE